MVCSGLRRVFAIKNLHQNFARLAWLLGLAAALAAAPSGAQEVQPDYYREPGLYPNREYVNPLLSG
jgi:hypothetical protein